MTPKQVLQHSSENTHEATDEQAGPSECIETIPAQRAESLTAGNQSPVDDVLQPTAARESTEGSPILQAPPIRRKSPIRADYGVTALLVFALCATVFLEQVTKHSRCEGNRDKTQRTNLTNLRNRSKGLNSALEPSVFSVIYRSSETN